MRMVETGSNDHSLHIARNPHHFISQITHIASPLQREPKPNNSTITTKAPILPHIFLPHHSRLMKCIHMSIPPQYPHQRKNPILHHSPILFTRIIPIKQYISPFSTLFPIHSLPPMKTTSYNSNTIPYLSTTLILPIHQRITLQPTPFNSLHFTSNPHYQENPNACITNTPLTLIPKQNPTIHILILPMPLPEQHSSVRQIQNVHCGRYHQQDENLPLTHTLLFPPGFASSSGWIATPCRKPLPKNTYASPISSNLTYTDSPTSSWSGTSHRS